MELNIAAACAAIAATHPDRQALVTSKGSWTWAEVQDRTRRLAQVLRDAGLGRHPSADGDPRWSSPHDHVALYLHNGAEYLEAMLGAWSARAAPFNVNYRYVADELRYLLDDAGARAVIVADCFAPVLADVLPTLRRRPELLLQVRDDSGNGLLPGAVEYEHALAAASPQLPEELVSSWSGDDLYLCYTGGTTGMPKGTMWRQADFVVAALGVRRRDRRSTPRSTSWWQRRARSGARAAGTTAHARRGALERAVRLARGWHGHHPVGRGSLRPPRRARHRGGPRSHLAAGGR